MTILKKEEEGLRTLAEGTDPVADVVLVHGLQGHPRTTWLFGPDISAQKKSRTGFFKSLRHKSPSTDEAQSSKHVSFFWPTDALAHDFPALRVATYGYDSRVSNFFSGSAAQTTIVGHGRSLLNELESFRRGVPADRPIIFIVHSLGGLVLKEALGRAYKAETYEPEWRAIYEATRAILFLGSPHSGSQFADWGLIARNVVSAVGFDASDSVLRDLQVDAAILDSLREDFSKLLREESFWVYTFMEQKGFKGVRGLNDKIVPDASATLGYARERKYYINANHVEMCRFCGNADKDNGYRQVKDAIAKSLEGSPPAAPRSGTTPRPPHFSKHKQILDILRVDSSYSLRYEQVEVAFGDSFSWLFTKEELGFEDWLREGGGLYWIRGLPATGKSTLMKMAYNHERTKKIMQSKPRKQVRAEFFFHDRGSTSQKSFTGLLHGILYQVLSAEPGLLHCVEESFDLYFGRQLMAVQPESAALSLDHGVLWTAFQRLLHQEHISIDVYLFLDALDEYSGAKVEIAEFVKAIALKSSVTEAGTKIHVCFSSRPENDLLDHFEPLELPGFDIKDHTAQDIAIVVRAMMRDNYRMLSVLDSNNNEEKTKATRLCGDVCARAEGVFLWVRLVLQDMLQEYTDGKSLDGLLDLLAMLPFDLEQYYAERVVDRIRPQHRTDALIMMDIVRCAVEPLTPLVFYCIFLNAQRSDLRDLTKPTGPAHDLSQNLRRLLRSRSGGLIEISKAVGGGNSGPRIQFIHLTVKAWVSKTKTRERVSPDLALRSTGYEYYSRYCVSSMNCSLNSGKRVAMPGSSLTESFFVESSLTDHLFLDLFLRHCAIAEHETQTAQTEILIQLKDKAVLSLSNSLMWAGEMQREIIPNLLSFAVAAELEIFLSECTTKHPPSQQGLNSALYVAVNLPRHFTVDLSSPTRRGRIIRFLLDLGANADSKEGGLTVFQQLWIHGSRNIGAKSFTNRQLPDAQITGMFLKHGQSPDTMLPFTEHMSKRVWVDRVTSPLHLACKRAELDTVRILIGYGSSVNSLDSQRQTPLDRAARHLGARIHAYLNQRDEANEEYTVHRLSTGESLLRPTNYSPDIAAGLQARLTCISVLLDAGAKLGYNPDMSEAIYDDFHFDEAVTITQAHIDDLLNRGFDVDCRILNLPKLSQSLVGLVGNGLSVTKNWLTGNH